MAYLGRGLDKISNIEVLDNITFDGSSSYSITKGSVAFTPNSAQSCLISIDGVVQATNFTVSSSTIDFGVAIPSTSVCNFFLHYGTGVMTVPSDGSVTLDKLSATGTKSATTFLRGDNTFATPTDNGKVLQVLFNNSNATVSTTSQSYVTSNQSLSITPSSTSSKILILFNCTVSTLSANTGISIEIRRGGSAISDFDTGMYTAQVGGNLSTMGSTSFLDTPNTTSATTYEVFFKETALAGTVNLSKRRLHLMEIGA